jgi:hypothetical protein
MVFPPSKQPPTNLKPSKKQLLKKEKNEEMLNITPFYPNIIALDTNGP